MQKFLKQLAFLICLMAVLVLPYLVFAQPSYHPLDNLEDFATLQSGYETADETTFADILSMVIRAFLSLLGIIFLVLIIVAGYNWMTAGGNDEKVTKAKSTIARAIIGLIIIVAAYAITYFVFSNLSSGGGGGRGWRPGGNTTIIR
jgi:amino acid transporter